MELTNDQKIALKGKGYIITKDDIHFSCRVVAPAGKLSAEQAKKIAEISEKYGSGSFYITQRLNIEIPWVAYKDLEPLTNELAQVGLNIGSAGKKVKPVHTCKGVICKYSLYDTEALTIKMNERLCKDDQKLPSKTRITISGCSNSCSSPRFSCIGIQGKKKNQLSIMIGGAGGKRQILGKDISGLYSEDEVINIVEKVIEYYKENGLDGERLATLVERVGIDEIEKFLV